MNLTISAEFQPPIVEVPETGIQMKGIFSSWLKVILFLNGVFLIVVVIVHSSRRGWTFRRLHRYVGAIAAGLASCLLSCTFVTDIRDVERAMILVFVGGMMFMLSYTCCIIVVLQISKLLDDYLENKFRKTFQLGRKHKVLVYVCVTWTVLGFVVSEGALLLTKSWNLAFMIMVGFSSLLSYTLIGFAFIYIYAMNHLVEGSVDVPNHGEDILSTFHKEKCLISRLKWSLIISFVLLGLAVPGSILAEEHTAKDSVPVFKTVLTMCAIILSKEIAFYLCQVEDRMCLIFLAYRPSINRYVAPENPSLKP